MNDYLIYDNQYEYGDTLYAATTPTFSDYFPTFEKFKEYYTDGTFPITISEANLKILYHLLLSRYAIEPVSFYYDNHQFVLNVFSIIFQYGPTWEKRLEVQQKIRGWKEDEILTGYLQIHNTALNPGTKPRAEDGIIERINQQNTSEFKKDRMSAYTMWLSMLEEDVSEPFIERFRPLFSKWYDTNPALFKSQHLEVSK